MYVLIPGESSSIICPALDQQSKHSAIRNRPDRIKSLKSVKTLHLAELCVLAKLEAVA